MVIEREDAPYVGPRPYGEADRSVFFARDAEIEELISLVIAHRCVLLYSVSGAGKSSLLRAGLSAPLRDRGFQVLGPVRFQAPEAPPADAPNVYSYAVVRALGVAGNGDTGQPLLDPAADLKDALAGVTRPTDDYGFASPRVLVLDQVEEIFTVYQERWEHREKFLRQLAAALDRDPELRVILSMREEYLAELERFGGLLPDGLRARFHLERLRAPAALEAVTRPLAQRGVEFAPGVAERLVHDLRQTRIDVLGERVLEVEGEFVEPVHLQVVCRTLWARLGPSVRRVTAGDLAALGNVDESLARYYDDAIASARARTSIREPVLRREIERLLITSAGTRATVFAGAKETASLPSVALDELADRHLIRAEWRAGGRWLELAHDRLIEPIRRSNAAVLERHRRRRLLRFVGATVVLLVVVTVSVVAVSSVWFSKVTVPNVVGARSAFEAERRLQQAGLTLARRQRELVRNRVAPGTVLGQSPTAGTKVDPGSKVEVEIATGAGKLLVPDITGRTLAAAERRLRSAGLAFAVTSGAPTNEPAVVVSQTPAAGQVVSSGTQVSVSVEPISTPTAIPTETATPTPTLSPR